MLKKKRAVIAVVLVCIIVLAAFVCSFLASTVSEDEITNSLNSSAVYTEITDGAEYGSSATTRSRLCHLK